MTQKEYKEALRRLKISRREARVEAVRAKTENQALRVASVQERKNLQTDIAMKRSDAENLLKTIPVSSAAEQDVVDGGIRAKLMSAVPWLLGAAGVVGLFIYMKKRRS